MVIAAADLKDLPTGASTCRSDLLAKFGYSVDATESTQLVSTEHDMGNLDMHVKRTETQQYAQTADAPM